jgi:hypothetical protein
MYRYHTWGPPVLASSKHIEEAPSKMPHKDKDDQEFKDRDYPKVTEKLILKVTGRFTARFSQADSVSLRGGYFAKCERLLPSSTIEHLPAVSQ